VSHGVFETQSKKYQADFCTVTVPENRDNAKSRIIHVPVIRIHSVAKIPSEPIFGLAGGPGMSNMHWKPLDSLLAEHDFVMVGYRGADGSTVLDCPEVAKTLKTDDDILSEGSLKRIGEAWTKSAQRLTEAGLDLSGYSMKEVIEDFEAARKALGYERIDLLSESYGTRLAYLYGVHYPKTIYRSVMIGVNPPGHFVWDPQTVDAQLNKYAELWAKDSAMAVRTPDLARCMRDVLHNMPRRWLLFGINPGKVRAVTFALLYSRKTAAMVFNAYAAAERGDASGLALMSIASDFVLPKLFVWGDLISKGAGTDFDSTRDYSKEMIPPNAVLGSPISKLLFGSIQYSHWPVRELPSSYRTLQRSEVQTLLLSGSMDFSTPAEYATNELLPYLPNGRQVILSEVGHVEDVWQVEPRATEKMVTTFFDTGITDTSLVKYVPMDFHVGWGFPRLAKAALGIVVVLMAALVSVIIWLIRR
jgi:pimeloyl-ACP methyl ester carboxylesterase